ncbi:MAG: hypothetical protein IJT59_00625 [Desulfovibrionaceae bacterium]|nr:hypothetical protein [Desulfovibrionaceae bacterium]
MGAGKYTYDPSNINALIINDAGNTINLSLSVYDSNNNLVTNYAPLTGESTTVNVYNSNSTSFPTFSLSPDSATGSLTATQNGNGVDFTIDMGNGNTFSKSYSNALNLSGAMFVVTNKIKDPDEPAEIPDDVVKIHFGTGNDSSEDYYYINKSDATINGLGLSGVTIDTQEGAQKSLETIDDAIVKKDEIRAYYGTMQNRLENTLTNLSVQAENLQAAETRISDADVATEMMHFVRNQILTQSALAMLSQANNIPQMAMRLIV